MLCTIEQPAANASDRMAPSRSLRRKGPVLLGGSMNGVYRESKGGWKWPRTLFAE